MKKQDGRTKEARLKKEIREIREFGKKFNISNAQTELRIKMKLAGYRNIAGLDKKGLEAMKPLFQDKLKHKIKKVRNKDYYTVWRKN